MCSLATQLMGYIIQNCKEKIKRYMHVLKGTSSAEIWKKIESFEAKNYRESASDVRNCSMNASETTSGELYRDAMKIQL